MCGVPMGKWISVQVHSTDKCYRFVWKVCYIGRGFILSKDLSSTDI